MREILYSDEDIEISADVNKKMYFIHTIVHSWSISKYKKYLSIFAIEMEKLKALGIDGVFTISPTPRDKKWQELFGFFDTGIKVEGLNLMRFNICQQQQHGQQ